MRITRCGSVYGNKYMKLRDIGIAHMMGDSGKGRGHAEKKELRDQ